MEFAIQSENLGDVLATKVKNQALKDPEGKVAVYVSNTFKQDVLNNFVILFYDNVIKLLKDKELKLGTNDLLIVFQLCKYAEYGNLINISQKKLSKDTDLAASVVCRSMKKLLERGVLIKDEDEGNTFLNPQIITKGKLHKISDDLMKKSKLVCQDNQLELGFDKQKH